MICDFPYLFGWDTSYDCILRNVVKDHSSGTYHSMITYRYSTTDGSMRTYPTPGAMKHMSPIVIGLVSRKVTPKFT